MMQGSGADPDAGRGRLSTFDWHGCIMATLANTQPRHDRQDWLIPGLTLAQTRAYRDLFPPAPIPAAVLVPLIDRPGGMTVLLTQRASQLKRHAGQISFPGGHIETADQGPLAAALREAREEIGLDERLVSLAGYLPDHILLSGYRVTPVVAFVQPGFELLLDEREVEDSFEIPLSHAFEPLNHRARRRRFGQDRVDVEVWDITYGERNVWGATAGMLINLYRLCAPKGPGSTTAVPDGPSQDDGGTGHSTEAPDE
ncbi:MAG TPA: CoA pyrophosphatase [Steroidobacteraceae bacterium]|nr:CoA pyrophosphatase [Steroidobacteraceae bacterium]